jgi:phage-related minor tail protein
MLGLGLDASGALREAQRLADLMRRELGGAGAGGAKSADEIADALRRATDAAEATKRAMGGAMDEARRAQEAARSADALSDALRRSGAAASELRKDMQGLETASEQAAQALARANPAKSLAAARDVLDIRSFTAIQREIDQVNAAYKRLSDSGKLSSAELQHAAAAQQAAIARLNAEMGKVGHIGQQSAAQTAMAFRQLPMQLQDVFVSLAGGMNPLMVLTQQGPQITSSFGGVKETFKAITGAISPMAAGLMGGLAAVATLGTAYAQGSGEADAYAKALVMTGNAAGSTVGQMQQVAVSVSGVVGTQAAAAEAVAALAATGRIAAADLERLTLVTVQWERATGQAASEVAKQFAELGKAPLEASLKLNESLHYLTQSTINQVRALEDEGRANEAARVAQEAYAAAMEQRAGQITARLGAIESAWKAVKDGAASAWDAMLGIGRKQTIEGMLAESSEKIARMEANAGKSARLGASAGSIEAEKRRQRDLQIEASDAAKRAGNRAAEAKQLEAKAKWDKDAQQYLSKEEQKTKAIAKMRGEAVAAGASEAEIRTRIAGIEDKYKETAKKPKSNIGAFNRQEGAEVALAKAQAQAALAAEIDATNAIRKELERRHSMGLDASGDYYQQLAALAERESKAKLAAIDAEAAAEKARATKDPASAKQSEARLIEIATKRAQEVAAAREKAADIGAQAEREALDESRRIAQEWAQSWQAADKMAQQYAGASAKAQAAMIVDPLERARAEASIAAQQIADDGAQMMIDLGNQIDTLSGKGLTAQADALRAKLDQIREGIKAEQERTIAAPDVAMVADYLGKESPGQKIAEGFDAASQSLSAFVTGFQSLFKVEENYSKAISARGLTSQQIADIEAKHSTEQINAYGTMAGAAKGMFKSHTAGFKIMAVAEKAFRAVELAMAIKSAAVKMGLFGSTAAAKVAAVATETGAVIAGQGVETGAVVAGEAARNTAKVPGVFMSYMSMLGPFGMAAAGAAVAAVLGGAFGSKGSAAPTSADRQESQGTGTVLGDDSAKSQSVTKSLDRLRDVNTMTMQYSAQMLASLRGIEAAMAGVSTQILRAGGVTTGKNLGINTESKGTGDAIGSLLSNIPLIGGALGGIVGGIVSGIFGKSSSTITDAGLSIGGTAAQMQQGQGVSQYADKTTTKKSWFSSSTKTSTVMQDAGADVARQFGLIFGGVSDSLQSAAGAMGQDAAAVARRLAGYVIDIPRLSLQGLKGDDLQEAISTAVGAKADEMARMVAPGLVDFQRIGEGYFETVTRVASATESAGETLRRLGVASVGLGQVVNKGAEDIGAEIVRQSITTLEGVSVGIGSVIDMMAGSASELADTYKALRSVRDSLVMMGVSGSAVSRAMLTGAGGLEQLASGVTAFEEEFFSESERTQMATARMAGEFKRLGVAMPSSRAGFRSLVTGIDTSTEAGQQLLGSLLPLSSQFGDLMGQMDELGGVTGELGKSVEDEIARIRGVIGQRDGQSMAGAQAAFTVATAQARAGDTKALESLPGLSQALLKSAEEQATTRADLVRLQAQTAASLQTTLDTVRDAPVSVIAAPVTGVPGVIAPAAQTGATAAPAAPAAQAGGGNSALLIELQALRTESAAMRAELQAMRAESASGLTTIATNTGRSARILDRVTAGGDTLQTEVVTL